MNANRLLPICLVIGFWGSPFLTYGWAEDHDGQPAQTNPVSAGLTPDEAAAAMTVPDGFQCQLSAAEPLVHQPIAFTIDHRGRLWVAEAFTYPQRAPDGAGQDRIIILEDQDRDGRFETRTVFAENLNLVSGLELGFGGVYVGAAPYLMFIPDTDRNDRPDGPPVILLDGFGYEDTHETLNAFIWGPDGWLYGCHGVFTHSRVGKPGTPDEERIPLNCGVWRYHPTRHEFEVFARGTSNPWGVDFNDHGHAIMTACVIPHLWHVIQGARYQRQGGQHFSSFVFDDIKTIAEHRHYVGNIQDHAWWGREPDIPTDTLQAGGGHAHCGAMIYLGNNWPATYRNQIFMHNVHGNRINNDLLKRKGSGYTGQRAPDLMLANDKWFRGINLKYGPDGSVYLIDWYDRNACHRSTPEIWDRTNGRIYNIAFGEPSDENTDLSRLSGTQLVSMQLHANDWYVRTARRLLQERIAAGQLAAAEIRRGLWNIAHEHPDVTRRLRAIWALHVCNQLTERDRLDLLQDDDEHVRCWAIQLELEDRVASPLVLERFAELSETDDSPIVRLYLSSALQRLPLHHRWSIAAGLLTHPEDSDDQNLPLLNWYGIAPLAAEDPARLLHLAGNSKLPLIRRFAIRHASADPDATGLVARLLGEEADPQRKRMILDEMLRGFEGRADIPMPPSWNTTYARLIASPDSRIREQADRIAILMGDQRAYARKRAVLTSADAPLDKRREALDILARAQDQNSATAFQRALQLPELRAAAIRALASCDDPQTASAILAQFAGFSTEEKRDAIGTLTARPEYADALLTAIDEGRVARTDLHAYNVRQILNFDNADLQDKLVRVWGAIRESSADKREAIARYRESCSGDALAKANLSHGRQLFAETCANCHRLFGSGGQVGPDITGSNRANLDYILENIVDPSAVLGRDYRMTVLELADGRVVSGLIGKETDSAVTVRTLNDTLVIPKAEIDERQISSQSVMPEGLLDRLNTQDVTDLIAYLGSPSQVPLRGPDPPLDPESGAVAGALEGESIHVIQATQGATQVQSMSGFSGDTWSNAKQLWWTGGGPQAQLDMQLPAVEAATYDVEITMTRAPDYAVVRWLLDGQPLGEPVDLYAPTVVSTGVLVYKKQSLTAGTHVLSLRILGSNPKAADSHMAGLDYVRLVRVAE